jgi:hypothetical protein
MDILYGFCFYYGYFKYNNIVSHINKFKELEQSYNSYNFKLIINVMIDEKDNVIREKMTNELQYRIENDFNITPILTHNFNYGGTIAGLYDTYLYMKDNNLKNYYICYFEEDFYYINLLFLDESLKRLNTNDYIYIGESTCGSFKITDERDKKWTDGGYYFSKYNNLETIENKIGCFHKGNKDTKYDHLTDGIILGEVGFPSELFHNGFEYIGLNRIDYFYHNE